MRQAPLFIWRSAGDAFALHFFSRAYIDSYCKSKALVAAQGEGIYIEDFPYLLQPVSDSIFVLRHGLSRLDEISAAFYKIYKRIEKARIFFCIIGLQRQYIASAVSVHRRLVDERKYGLIRAEAVKGYEGSAGAFLGKRRSVNAFFDSIS